MAKKPVPVTIDPTVMYVVSFSAPFEHGGRRFIPRDGQRIKLRGSVVEAILDKIDGYEAA